MPPPPLLNQSLSEAKWAGGVGGVKVIIANQETLYIHNFIMWVSSCLRSVQTPLVAFRIEQREGTDGGRPGRAPGARPLLAFPASSSTGSSGLQVLKCSSARLAQGLYTCCSLGPGILCISFLRLRWHSTDWVAWNNGHASPCLAIVEAGSLESRCGLGPALRQFQVREGSLSGLSRLLALGGTPWHPLPCRCTTPGFPLRDSYPLPSAQFLCPNFPLL